MNLIFAKERTIESIKEAMFAGRSAAFFDNKLAGKEEYLKAIFEASVTKKPTRKTNRKRSVSYEVKNVSDIPFIIENLKNEETTIPARDTIILTVNKNDFSTITIKNLFIGSQKNLKVSLL